MYEFTTENITDAVIERMSTTPDPRLREIMACLVQHLHDFAREMKLTPDEWMAGIQFLTRIGHITTPVRQEFVLLSDTLGLSTLINTLHDRTAIEDATHTSLLGPFYREDAPELPLGSSISKKDKSQPVCLWGKITNVDGEPLKNAKVTVWQTASDGSYDLQQGDGSDVDYRGVFHTDENGTYYLKSVRAKGYYIPMDGPVGDMIRAQKARGLPSRPYSLPDQRAGLPRACLRALYRRLELSRFRRGVRCGCRSGGDGSRERSQGPDQGHSEHPFRLLAISRGRNRRLRPYGRRSVQGRCGSVSSASENPAPFVRREAGFSIWNSPT